MPPEHAGEDTTPAHVAVAVAGERAALWSPQQVLHGSTSELVDAVVAAESAPPVGGPRAGPGPAPRWVWWSAAGAAAPLVAAGVHLARCWDVAEAHRIIHGGWTADPPLAWALSQGLDAGTLPPPRRGDLFDLADDDEVTTDVVLDSGHLDPRALDADWLADGDRLVRWAAAAYRCAQRQHDRLITIGPRAVATAHAESAAALLCLELTRDGLPLDRGTAEGLIREAAGERATSADHAARIRAERDAIVLAHVPHQVPTDLRNPAQVRSMLAAAGVVVPTTRKGVLEAYRHVHPVVPALLTWRARERIATTYGYDWLDAHVGADDCLRGAWSACDGAAGRMTAQNGLHNLPATLRPAVAARPGHVFVRADLGQIEPRVLAAVSGDRAFAAATRADDLYAPVAQALGVDRPTAKVAVLAAMYGQRSGAAGEALRRLERTYPVAMAHLDRAYAAGVRHESIRTFGGRLVRMDVDAASPRAPLEAPEGEVRDGTTESARARDAARGRYARNALVQGSAAELFKAWAVTVRATTRDLDARIVLCLHDEILVHVREDRAEEVVHRVETALTDAARRWTGSTDVRFVSDTSVIRRWSEAKE